jgi:murein L,D-transpeptidase YcbB/YkuD
MLLPHVLVGAAIVALGVSVPAQAAAPAPVPTTAPSAAPAGGYDDIALFYLAHPGQSVWLATADGRAAAAKVAALLKDSNIDGFEHGPQFAKSASAALARGLPGDDATISTAWVRYLQALKAPVKGITFGDPALQPKPPSAGAILSAAVTAPSVSAYVDSASAVNPLYAALRRSAIAQAQQDDPHVRATLERLRLIPATGRAILVDAASAELTMLQDGQPVGTMKVIVGKPDFPTPMLASTIHYVTLNPYWHIPEDVARRKVAPIVIKRGVAYLKAARYQTFAAFDDSADPIDPTSVDWKAVAAGTTDAHIRQLTGPNNMMGAMKFAFQNPFGVYLHDTPHKDLFKKPVRYLSLGCIRLEHAEQLATWLLGHDPTPSPDEPEQHVLISQGVPVFVTYLTARPEGETIAFASDVYKLDGAGAVNVASASTGPATQHESESKSDR